MTPKTPAAGMLTAEQKDSLAASVADQFVDAVGHDCATQIKDEIVKLLSHVTLASLRPTAEDGLVERLIKEAERYERLSLTHEAALHREAAAALSGRGKPDE